MLGVNVLAWRVIVSGWFVAVAVAAVLMTTVVEFVTDAIVVPLGIPGPAMTAPTSAGDANDAVALVTVVFELVAPSATVRPSAAAGTTDQVP